MIRQLLFILAFSLFASGAYAQIVYDDAEGTNLPWAEAFGDGVYNGRVTNPADQDPLGINGSAMVNSYTKSNVHGYSLLIAVLVDPIDLSVNNQFRVQVNAPVASQFIFKIEGAGEAMEQTRNIAVTNTWIEYTFDFSGAAGFTTINKFILFFDPGVETSGDTYLFDNIVALPAGSCAGTAVNPLIIDDFECQRNGTYGVPGYQDVTPISNPDPSGVNTSESVGRYCDTCGSEWHALVFDWNSPEVFPVTKVGSSIVNIKVWTNKAGVLKFKLEGGSSSAIERDVQVTAADLNIWREYSVDFSDQIGASHRKLVFFFNAGVVPDPTDIYFIDNIRLSEPPTGSALEDFEDGLDLDWSSLGNPAVFGSFNGAISNPDQGGLNDSPTVGSYTKGSSQFGGLQATLPLGFTLEDFPQLNLQIWAPSDATSFTMKLASPSQGLKVVTVDIEETETWQDLSFIYSDFQSITDFERVEIIFDENLASDDTWYFDNLAQGVGTVDPCEGIVPVANTVDDFDCQRNVAITNGFDRLAVVANPTPGGTNPDPLDKVGEYSDPQDEWSALVYDFGGPIGLTDFNQLNVRILSSANVPLLFKLEGGTTPAVEFFTNVTATGVWTNYSIDFSGAAATDHTRLAIFFNAGQLAGANDVYYIDDILWRREPFTACVMDFETAETSFTDWVYFGAGKGTLFEVVTNPAQGGVNPSANVGVFLEPAGDPVWAGMFVDLPAPIAMPVGNKTIKMKVWSDHEAPMVMKMEGGLDGAPGSGDNSVLFSTPNQWSELTFDFTSLVPDNALYGRLTLILDIANAPAAPVTYYFDDIEIANSNCGTSGIFNPISVDKLAMYPNPASDYLLVEQTEDLSVFRIMNMMGQTVSTHVTSGQSLVELEVGNLVKGVYVLTAYDAQGALKASGRFVKE